MSLSAFYPQSNREKNLGLNNRRWDNLYIDRIYYRQATQDSDLRLKENIQQLPKGLEEILKLKPYKYNYKDDNETKHYGFVAQELNDILPILVSSINDDAEETLTVNITEIIPILVKAIQEQQTLIDSQKSKIENLETAVLAIQNQLGLQVDHSTQAGE